MLEGIYSSKSRYIPEIGIKNPNCSICFCLIFYVVDLFDLHTSKKKSKRLLKMGFSCVCVCGSTFDGILEVYALVSGAPCERDATTHSSL